MLNSTKPQSYWDECLPSSNPLKEHDYVRIQEDPGAKDLACDNPELAAAIGELQDRVKALEKENLCLLMILFCLLMILFCTVL